MVSVVLPVYNGELFLAQAIESVLQQSYKEWELVIVDDCSTDNTPQIIDSYRKKDARIKVIHNHKNQRLPKSLNIGFENCNGEYYTWISADNMFDTNALELLYDFIVKTGADIVYSGYYTMNEHGKRLNKVLKLHNRVSDILYINLVGASFLYKKEVQEALKGYDENLFLIEDYDFWIRAYKMGFSLKYLNRCPYFYRIHNESLTSMKQQQIRYMRIKLFSNNLINFKDFGQKRNILNRIIQEYKGVKKMDFPQNMKLVKEVAAFMKYDKNRKRHKNVKLAGKTEQKIPRALKANEWGKHYNMTHCREVVEKIKNGVFTVQTKEMLQLTEKGQKVLEIGCGTGETSVVLSKNGRNITALDYSKEALNLVKNVSKKCCCELELVNADATAELPFAINEFDVIFQAGLLEHFDKSERIRLLYNWSKCGKIMVSLIPNANSVPYRLGKMIMEKNGTWKYGKELPQASLKDEFLEAGLKVADEYTIGAEHALRFLPKGHYMRKAFEKWIKENKEKDIYGQGYLLVTIGTK